jgi:transcriptional/translational regulatory protein YebC/TACO1
MNPDDYVEPMIVITQEEYKTLLKTEEREEMLRKYIEALDLESIELYGYKSVLFDESVRIICQYSDTEAVKTALEKRKTEMKGDQEQ